MNENSKPKQQTISSALKVASELMSLASIESSQLDAELLLAHTLDVDRTWLRAHDQDILSADKYASFISLVKKRCNYEPVAYLRGYKEFYGREFIVTKDTLIPRPESEDIITFLIEETASVDRPEIIDIGTGSGVLGISAKLEIPKSEVLLTDVSHQALEVARRNAKKLTADVGFIKTNLIDCLSVPDNSFILANLPYVDETWDFLSNELSYEPSLALYAQDNGLELIYRLINDISSLQSTNITVFIESDTIQQDSILNRLQTSGFIVIKKSDYVIVALKS